MCLLVGYEKQRHADLLPLNSYTSTGGLRGADGHPLTCSHRGGGAVVQRQAAAATLSH